MNRAEYQAYEPSVLHNLAGNINENEETATPVQQARRLPSALVTKLAMISMHVGLRQWQVNGVSSTEVDCGARFFWGMDF